MFTAKLMSYCVWGNVFHQGLYLIRELTLNASIDMVGGLEGELSSQILKASYFN